MKAKKIFNAKWTKDCQDKWDYDFSILRISTRYWNRDFSSMPSIMMGDKVIKKSEHYIIGTSQADCKRKTELWVEQELEKLLVDLKKVGYNI